MTLKWAYNPSQLIACLEFQYKVFGWYWRYL